MTSGMSFTMSGLRQPKRTFVLSTLCLIAVTAQSTCPSFAGTQTIGAAIDAGMPADAHSRLMQLEKRRLDYQKRASELRKKHEQVRRHITEINKNLDKTKTVLHVHTEKLAKTETKIVQTEEKIEKTQETTDDVASAATKRLREIFEGQRVSFLEMMLEVDSLPALLDRLYFQERVAEQDKSLLDTLRAKASALEANKSQLGEQRNQLGALVSEFARKAIAMAKEKVDEEQVAGKLKTQQNFYEQAEKQLAEESQRLETQIQELAASKSRSNKVMVSGSGNMAMPISGPVTSPFGWRRHPIFGVRKFHTGVDLAGPNHAAVRAADSGNVLYTGWYGGYGKVVILSHGKGMATLYAHMSKTNVAVDQNVAKGDIVGYEGTTGFSTGPHLHFEVRVNGKPNNPLAFLH
ncbi:MAG TPA: peptidoglycan DD-metalloendopeptidase family protein [Oculatellaceae cyanobacterium]